MPQSKKRKGRKPAKPKPKTPQEANAGPKVEGGVVVSVSGGSFQLQVIEGTTPREIPTLLRQAAAQAEKQLIGE